MKTATEVELLEIGIHRRTTLKCALSLSVRIVKLFFEVYYIITLILILPTATLSIRLIRAQITDIFLSRPVIASVSKEACLAVICN